MAKKKSNNEVTIKVEGKEWIEALDKAFKEKVKTVTVDGFRKGKVPRDIYEKKFGKESLYFPASDYVVDAAFKKAIEATDDATATEYYKECEWILAREAANVYIQDLAEMVAINKNYTGYEFYPIYVLDIAKIKPAK